MKKVSSSSSLSSSSTDLSKPVNKPKTKRIRRNIETEKPHFGGGPGRRSSIYRGVTRHRWTGRYEAHLWDKNSWNPVQNKKGRQVYLGAYDDEEAAAHTYDLAALKYWGSDTILNFPLATYAKEYEAMQTVSKEEYLATLRRRSSGFSRGVSKYRGVARHHHNGRWEARIGRVFGNKYLYLGTYSTQEEAAAAYDMAAIEYRGLNAVTNFDISRYFNINQQPKPYHPQSHHHYTAGLGTFVDRTEVREPFNEHNHHHQHYLVQDISNSIVDEPPMLTDEPSVASDIVDHPWSVCMAPIFNTIPDSDISSHAGSGELQDLFGDVGFEENIDFLFDGAEVVVESCEQKTGTQVHVNAILENSDNFGGEFLNEVEQEGEHGLTLGDTLSAYTCPISICT